MRSASSADGIVVVPPTSSEDELFERSRPGLASSSSVPRTDKVPQELAGLAGAEGTEIGACVETPDPWEELSSPPTLRELAGEATIEIGDSAEQPDL